MPEPVGLDEVPFDDDPPSVSSVPDKVPCPECGSEFKPSGLKRHITVAHRTGVSDTPATTSSTGGTRKTKASLGPRWAQFQRGIALLVSLACTQCATALNEDAENDGAAIESFCQNRPKLKKQVEQFLAASDFMLLVGAFGGTAQKMVSHHSIGQKLPFGMQQVTTHTDSNGENPMQRMAGFLNAMPPEARHQLLDQALNAQARQAEQAAAFKREQAAAPPPIREPDPVQPDNAPGAEPPAPTDELTDYDRETIAAVQGNGAFAATATDFPG